MEIPALIILIGAGVLILGFIIVLLFVLWRSESDRWTR